MKDVKIGQIVQIKNKAATGLDKTKLYFVKDKFIGDNRTVIAPLGDKCHICVDEYYGGTTTSMEHSNIIDCEHLKLVSNQSYDITKVGFTFNAMIKNNSESILLSDEDFTVFLEIDKNLQFYILKSLFEIEGFNYFVIIDKNTKEFKHFKIESSIGSTKAFEISRICLIHLLYNKPTKEEFDIFVRDLKARTLGVAYIYFANKTVPISIINEDSTFIAYSPEEDCTYNLTLDYWTRALSLSRSYKEYNVYVEDFYYDICQGNECLPEYKFDNSLSDKENINNNNIMIAKFIEDKKLYLVNVNF